MAALDVHQKLADLLGIDYKSERVAGFDVHCHVGEAARVVVTYLKLSANKLGSDQQEFELKVLPPRPFDLDRMCKEASTRLQAFIEQRASEALRAIKYPRWVFIPADGKDA